MEQITLEFGVDAPCDVSGHGTWHMDAPSNPVLSQPAEQYKVSGMLVAGKRCWLLENASAMCVLRMEHDSLSGVHLQFVGWCCADTPCEFWGVYSNTYMEGAALRLFRLQYIGLSADTESDSADSDDTIQS